MPTGARASGFASYALRRQAAGTGDTRHAIELQKIERGAGAIFERAGRNFPSHSSQSLVDWGNWGLGKAPAFRRDCFPSAPQLFPSSTIDLGTVGTVGAGRLRRGTSADVEFAVITLFVVPLRYA